MNGELILFALFAAISVICGIGLITNENPVRCALNLVGVLLSVAMLFLLLHASFIAAIQVIVYAGAIMVLFVFVIMLLNLGTPERVLDHLKAQKPMAAIAALVLVVVIVSVVLAVPTQPQPKLSTGMVSPYDLALQLFSPSWVFPFEAISILLLVAVVGSVILAKRRLD
jgi:NADH-quinone oxidoreductase subunit J